MRFKLSYRLFLESLLTLKLVTSALMIILILILSGCGGSDASEAVAESSELIDDSDFEVTDWSEESHSKSASPDYDEVFDSGQVKRLDFVITEERWQSMLDDMTNLYGEFGQFRHANNPANNTNQIQDIYEQAMTDLDDTEDPIFVPGEVYYNGKQWYKVGLRFKGNSSLKSSWQQGILKLSFKLDFDEFEDNYPQIDNQRFYGFKKLSLKNNYQDSSFLREKVAADVFANAGMVVSHTAFYALYIDHGNGPNFFGLYTLVEEVNDTVIETQFSSDQGNLYKPEGDGASFVAGAFDESSFEKKTNQDESDWSDIQALFAALHDDQSTAEVWRANLEAIFDVDVFLKYLAVNGVIQNWDTYGRMTHNFYLYNDPSTEKLTWIPWDHNEALQDGKMGGALALDFSNYQSNEWPLIAKIMADDVYKAMYDEYLFAVVSDSFEPAMITSLYDDYAYMIEPYATEEVAGYTFLNSVSDFIPSINELKEHVYQRQSAVDDYLHN